MELWNTPICLLILLSIPSYVLPLQDKLKGHQISIDQSGLLAFKKSISSDPQNFLDNWNKTTHICQWNGVSCSQNRTRVTGLDLKRKYLQGTISPFLCNLSYLEQLDLSENSLHGSIPIEFGSLSSLEEFSLRANQVQDEVPESFGQLKHLRFIDLSRNQLRGRLPLSLFYNCTILQYVDLSDNMFIGFIPSQIGHHLYSLETLRLYLNQLSGIIPASLSNSSSLMELDLEYNFLTGTLPSEILQNMPLLEILYLSGNSLESNDANTNLSPFFTSISNLTHLRELQLAGNMLGGKLPAVIGMLNTNLSEIHLEDNLIHDFGIARLVMDVGGVKETTGNTDSSTANLLCGSIGYIAPGDQIPEVRNTWEISIIELLELGLLCTQETPSTRPTMIDAADDLDRLKRYLSGDNTMTFASSLGLSSSVVILKN
ncbi:Leucine-rich repeat receptor-like protein kinase [Thalictrum thalictroides]|uniref:Leucine-rich repeat receptor-like protein kinase n=1 Tax=Thalictrum thalictroides TaxID=46969 RepID=A0A7J6WIY0_THATH|nr:Leucine-rich repeat receptor-like protein kinase [Thalictrum thalictroides]